MPSLCDKCFAPGACCRDFALSDSDGWSRYWLDDGLAGIDKQLAERGYPFIAKEIGPSWTDDETGRPYGYALVMCPNLDEATGRCADYENRPDTCRVFEPGSASLCVHYRGAEAGDPTVNFE